jgi:hypothetical protein
VRPIAASGQQINRMSGRVIIVLSLIALVTVLIGYTQPPLPDEGALAHIFQISVAALVPMILLFLASVDWKTPWPSMRPLAFSCAFLFAAFAMLYYLEHYFYPHHYH